MSYSWLHPTANSSSSSWIRLKADSILQISMCCSWFCPVASSSPSAGLDLWLTYTLIYQVNLRTYSAKYIIFIVCFLPPDFSYYWFGHLLLLQEAWRSFKTLAATDSSCSGWFELRWLIWDLQDLLNQLPPEFWLWYPLIQLEHNNLTVKVSVKAAW